jgi:hypothetical protein
MMMIFLIHVEKEKTNREKSAASGMFSNPETVASCSSSPEEMKNINVC